MVEVKIILEGFTRKISENEWEATPNVVLIKDSGKNILVDPGSDRKILEALEKEKLKPEEIDMIFLTHFHLDHLINIRFFPNTDIVEGRLIHKNEKEFAISDKIPGTNINIIPTPGHAYEHFSLIIETGKGKICVAGDLWFFENDKLQKTDFESLMSMRDEFVKDERALKESRKKILQMSDWIIPAHGKMFKIEKSSNP